MDDLVVIAFPGDRHRATEVLTELRRDPKVAVDMDDAVVVTRETSGRVRVEQSVEMSVDGARRGAFWGLLVGLVLAMPFPFLGPAWLAAATVGASAVGAGVGALIGTPSDVGIDERFAREVGEQLQPGSSAIFLLLHGVSTEELLPQIAPYGGTLLQTTLSSEAQERIREVLAGEAGKREPS